VPFVLPPASSRGGSAWNALIDTLGRETATYPAGATYPLSARSLVVFEQVRG
jgi:hypothetical protein